MGGAEVTDVVRATVEEGVLPSGDVCGMCGHDDALHYVEQTYYGPSWKFITVCCDRSDCMCIKTTNEPYESHHDGQ